MHTKTITLAAANEDAARHATVAFSGIVALLARSQARRIAEAARPANRQAAPPCREAQP